MENPKIALLGMILVRLYYKFYNRLIWEPEFHVCYGNYREKYPEGLWRFNSITDEHIIF